MGEGVSACYGQSVVETFKVDPCYAFLRFDAVVTAGGIRRAEFGL